MASNSTKKSSHTMDFDPAIANLRPERGSEIPEIPEILKSVLKCPEIH